MHSIRACEFKSFLTTDFTGVKSALTAGHHWILRPDNQVLGPCFFVSERGARNNLLKQRSLYSNRDVLPFAPHLDRGDVAAVLLRDVEHPDGSALILHDDAMSGTEIESELGSVAEWFRHDQEEISKEQHAPAGFAEPRDDWPA